MSQQSSSSITTSERRGLRRAGILFVVVVVVVVVFGFVSRAEQTSKLHDLTEAQAVANVAVVSPSSVENRTGLELPGRLEAFIRAPIYARVPGYLKSWKHDIGSKVKAGDLLAEIDAPDLDQQLAQSRGHLEVLPRPTAKLAEITANAGNRLAGHRCCRDSRRRSAHLHLQRECGASERRRRRLSISWSRRQDSSAWLRLSTASSRRARPTSARSSTSVLEWRRGAVRRLGHEQAARVCQRTAELCAQRAIGHQGERSRFPSIPARPIPAR
jgi:multidrug efflux pump subunit AcrA (membrane-fusion protein)